MSPHWSFGPKSLRPLTLWSPLCYISTKQDRTLPPSMSEWVWAAEPRSWPLPPPGASYQLPLSLSGGSLSHCCHLSLPPVSVSHHSPPVLTALWLALFLTSQVLTLAWSPSHLGARSVPYPCPGHDLQWLPSTYGSGVP